MSKKLRFILLYCLATIIGVATVAGCNVSKISSTIDMMKALPSNTNSLLVLDHMLVAEVSDFEDILLNYVPSEARQNLGNFKGWTGIAQVDSNEHYAITKYLESDDVPDLGFLGDRGFVIEEYLGAEIWSSESRIAYIILDDMFITTNTGNAKTVVDCKQEESLSMYGDKEFRLVVDDLGRGLFTIIVREVSINDVEAIAGITLRKIEGVEKNLEFIGNFNFKTKGEAENMQDFLTNFLVEKWCIVDITSHQEGKIIKIEGELEIENFIDFISAFEKSTS